jgi:hypothetical protein
MASGPWRGRKKKSAFVDLVGRLDDAARGGLAEDLRKSRHRHDAAVDEVGEDPAGSDGGQLVGVSDEDDAAVGRDRLHQARHEAKVDHGGFVDDEEIAGEGTMAVSRESGHRLILEGAVQGEGLASGAFGKALGGASGRGAEDGLDFFRREDFDEGAEDRRLAGPGSAGEDEEPRGRGPEHGFLLLRRELQRMVALEP